MDGVKHCVALGRYATATGSRLGPAPHPSRRPPEKSKQLYLASIPSALPDIRKGIRVKAS